MAFYFFSLRNRRKDATVTLHVTVKKRGQINSLYNKQILFLILLLLWVFKSKQHKKKLSHI